MPRWDYLSGLYGMPTKQFATIGEMANGVLMFAHSGLSIAMSNGTPDVQRAARRVTSFNQGRSFAKAIERSVLPQQLAFRSPEGASIHGDGLEQALKK